MTVYQADAEKAPPYFQASQTLADGDSMDLNPGTQGLDTLEVHSIIHEASCDVSIRIDSTGGGTFDREVTIDSLAGNGISQGNEVELDAGHMVLRITDTSGGTDNDYIVTGELLR